MPQDLRNILEQLKHFEQRGQVITLDKLMLILAAVEDYDPVNVNLRNLPNWSPEVDAVANSRNRIETFKRTELVKDLAEWLSQCQTTDQERVAYRHGRIYKETRVVPKPGEQQLTSSEYMASTFAWRYLDWIDMVDGVTDAQKETIGKIRNYILPQIMDDEAFITGEGDGNRDKRAVLLKSQLDQLKQQYSKMVGIVEENKRLKAEVSELKGKPRSKKNKGGSGAQDVNRVVAPPASGEDK